MLRVDCPCIECQHRSEICHAQCVAYHEWATKLREQRHKAYQNASGKREAKARQIDACIAHRKYLNKFSNR